MLNKIVNGKGLKAFAVGMGCDGSVNYTFGQALLTSCSILPGVLMAKYLGRDIATVPKKEAVKQCIYLSLAILFTMYLIIFCIHWFLLEMDTEAILLNPVFILLIVAASTAPIS